MHSILLHDENMIKCKHIIIVKCIVNMKHDQRLADKIRTMIYYQRVALVKT